MANDVRQDPRPRRRLRWAAPLAALLVLAALLAEHQHRGGPHVVAPLCAFGLAACSIVVNGPWPAYTCPACGLRLGQPTDLLPDPDGARAVRFACPRCEVEWETGWRVGGSDVP